MQSVAALQGSFFGCFRSATSTASLATLRAHVRISESFHDSWMPQALAGLRLRSAQAPSIVSEARRVQQALVKQAAGHACGEQDFLLSARVLPLLTCTHADAPVQLLH